MRVINARKKAFSVVPKALPWRSNHVTICLLCYSGESLQNGQLELQRQNWHFSPRDPQGDSHISLSLSGRILKEYWNIVSASKQNPMWYSMGFAKSHSLKCSLHKWAWCGAARKSAHLNCINLIHFRLTAGQLRGSSCIVIPGVVCELLQFTATQQASIVNFFVNHTHTQFTEESKTAIALTPQADITAREAYRK